MSPGRVPVGPRHVRTVPHWYVLEVPCHTLMITETEGEKTKRWLRDRTGRCRGPRSLDHVLDR